MKNFRYQLPIKITSHIKMATLLWLLPIATSGLIGVYYQDLPDKIPLFYSLPWGNDQLVPRIELLLLPLMMAIINGINYILATLLKKRLEGYLADVLIISSYLCNALTIIATIHIVLAVI